MIIADAVVEEAHVDRSTITRHPVEGGSTPSDNVVDEPYEVTLVYGFAAGSTGGGTDTSTLLAQNIGSGASLADAGLTQTTAYLRLQTLYEQFLSLKLSKKPFSVFTGKRQYSNMLIESLSTTTDKDTENCLLIRVVCTQLIIVQTTTFTLQSDPNNVADPSTGTSVAPQGLQQTPSAPLPSNDDFQNSLALPQLHQHFPGGV